MKNAVQKKPFPRLRERLCLEYCAQSFLQAAVRCKMGKCLFLQKVRLPDPMTRPKKNKGEDAEDGEITGSTEKTDDTEEPKTSGTGKTVPEIWNREWPSNVDLPSSYDYREHERAPKIGNQGSLGTCWAFASLTALESTLLPKQKETFSVDHMSMTQSFSPGTG